MKWAYIASVALLSAVVLTSPSRTAEQSAQSGGGPKPSMHHGH
jgi:hypothetical protein